MSRTLTSKKKIHLRIRKRIKGTAERPRLCVFRSNKAIYCQLIDDVSRHTLASSSSVNSSVTGTKVDVAKAVGQEIGEKAKALNVDTVVFDRAGYLYHGRVKALADGARESGLQF